MSYPNVGEQHNVQNQPNIDEIPDLMGHTTSPTTAHMNITPAPHYNHQYNTNTNQNTNLFTPNTHNDIHKLNRNNPMNNSHISTASTTPQFDRNSSSFAKSWTMQYVSHKTVPNSRNPDSKITPENPEMAYKTSAWDYKPFWWLSASHFILFIAYSLVINLLTSVYGPNASLSLAVLYACFVFSAVLQPPVNMFVFKNNTALTLVVGSMGYTIMMFCAIFGGFLLFFGAIVAGFSGGLVWVSFSSFLSIFSRYQSEQDLLKDCRERLHKRLKSDELSYKQNEDKIATLLQQLLLPNGRLNLSKLTEEQIKRLLLSTATTVSWVNTVGWTLLCGSSVIGSLISYTMLSSSSSEDTASAARPLFILFFFCGVVSNLFYFLTFKFTPSIMFASIEQPLQLDDLTEDTIEENDNLDLCDATNDQGEVIYHSKSQLFSQSQIPVQNFDKLKSQFIQGNGTIGNINDIDNDNTHNNNNNNVDFAHNNQNFNVNPSDNTKINIDNDSSDTYNNETNEPEQYKPGPVETILRSLYMMKNMLQQRVIYLSLWTWYQALFPISLGVSFFTSNAVKPTLGIGNVPLIMMTIYLTDSITAFVLSRFMKGFNQARWFGIIGSIIEVLFVILVLALPHTSWIDPEDPTSLGYAWRCAIFIGIACGIGDAIQQASTQAALGMLVEGSVLLRGGGFGIAQVCKCFGSITIFIAGRVMSWYAQVYMILIILIISIIFQGLNMYFHKTLDVDGLMAKFNQYVERQEEQGRLARQQAKNKQQFGNDNDAIEIAKKSNKDNSGTTLKYL